MEVNIYQVDAFTDKPFSGNPAGVVPDAKKLTTEDMQYISMEMNLSETAFVVPISKNEFNVRFFTPVSEVDLCGHATIGTFYTLAERGYIEGIDSGCILVYQNTKAGKLPVEIYYKNYNVYKVMMHQKSPSFRGYIEDVSQLCTILNIKDNDIGINGFTVKPEIISTGLYDIILPVKLKSVLDDINVDFKKLEQFTKLYDTIGLHVIYYFNENGNEKIYCRNFAPAVGINEEAATGTSNGAALYYLMKNDILQGNSIACYQGYLMGRESKILASYNKIGNQINIKVGGSAKIVLEGIVRVD